MSKFPELKPGMLVECKDSNDIYEFYLIIGKLNERLYEAYKLFISSTGEVELQSLVRIDDFAERAIAVYTNNVGDNALSTVTIARIANGREYSHRPVWQREQRPLEVTMEEVCEKFGCEVRIIKEVK